jgi:feruloyl esterase
MNLSRFLAGAGAAALVVGCAAETEEEAPVEIAKVDASQCAAVDAGTLGAAEASATWVAANAEEGLPAYCEVIATLRSGEGSNIGVVYRLPEQWNGKILGLGGGGWAGNVTLETAREGLKEGYATAQTDGGHESTDPWDNDWAESPQARTDFAYRAIHEMTVAGKELVAAFYDRAHDKAYFQGCSTGGRMALIEAQRYPTDYDAIISGAPVYTLQVQTTAILRNNLFGEPGASFTDEELTMVSRAVLAACDRDDGLEDGVIGDPRQCDWQPSTLQCAQGKSGDCLSVAQVKALEAAYAGIRSSDGNWAMFPLSKGGEASWPMYISTGGGEDVTNGGGLMTLWNNVMTGRPVAFGNFNKDRDVQALRTSTFAEIYEAKDPDLSEFFANGGKLILWHGESDPGPSPVGSNDYAEAVLAANGDTTSASFRHFLLPGVEHCRGGPGADLVDWLAAIDTWHSSGHAPNTLTATKADGSMKRRICAWPQTARYDGEGDPNNIENWRCGKT